LHFSISFLVQHCDAGVNEWLTIRNRGFDILKWLPICRLPASRGSDEAPRLARPGVMGAISGKSGAEGLSDRRFFRRTGAHQKKVLKPGASGEGFHL
jgi:hypothetical protein